MFADKKIAAFIPARAGSKRLKNKNTLDLGSKPLVAWTMDAAIEARHIDNIYVSSDDPKVEKIASYYQGITYLHRPMHLADDKSRNLDVMRYHLQEIETKFDYILLLQPTSPYRTGMDIDECISNTINQKVPCSISVSKLDKSSYWLFEEKDGRLNPLIHRDKNTDIRQPGPNIFYPNGAIFCIETDRFMTGEDWYSNPPMYHEIPFPRNIDIDTEADLQLAEFYLNRRNEINS